MTRERSAVGVAAPAAARGGPRRPRGARRRDGPAAVAARARLARRSAARPSRATSCSSRRSTAGSTRSRRGRARRSGVTARRPASTAARPSPATCCSCPPARRTATSRARDRSSSPTGPRPARTIGRRMESDARAQPDNEQLDARRRRRSLGCSRTSRRSSTARPSEIKLVLAALASGGHVLFEDVPGTAKTVLARSIAGSIDGATVGRIQCTPDIQPTDVTGLSVFNQQTRDVRVPAGPGVRERAARRRDQPRDAEDAVRAARGDGGAPGDGRRRHAPAARPVPAARDGEPDRAGGNVPAARGAARPLLAQDRARLPDRSTRRSRSSAASARRTRSRGFGPSSTSTTSRELEQALEHVYTDELLLRWIIELVAVTRTLETRRARRLGSCQPRARADRRGPGRSSTDGTT